MAFWCLILKCCKQIGNLTGHFYRWRITQIMSGECRLTRKKYSSNLNVAFRKLWKFVSLTYVAECKPLGKRKSIWGVLWESVSFRVKNIFVFYNFRLSKSFLRELRGCDTCYWELWLKWQELYGRSDPVLPETLLCTSMVWNRLRQKRKTGYLNFASWS